jgi:hypothetical protein
MESGMTNAQSLAPVESAEQLIDFEIGERLFIWGFRAIVQHRKCGKPAISELERVYNEFGVDAALWSVDALVQAFALTAHTAIEVHCPGCPCISEAELSLLRAAAGAQRADFEIARREFERWLPVAAADWALAPARGLGQLFQAAGLRFPWREEVLVDQESMAVGGSSVSRALH